MGSVGSMDSAAVGCAIAGRETAAGFGLAAARRSLARSPSPHTITGGGRGRHTCCVPAALPAAVGSRLLGPKARGCSLTSRARLRATRAACLPSGLPYVTRGRRCYFATVWAPTVAGGDDSTSTCTGVYLYGSTSSTYLVRPTSPSSLFQPPPLPPPPPHWRPRHRRRRQRASASASAPSFARRDTTR